MTKSKRKCWDSEEVQILLDNYEIAETEQEIKDLFPNRTWEAIKNKAQSLRLNRVALHIDDKAMIADYLAGMSYKQCTQYYGISTTEFFRRLKRYEVSSKRKMTDYGDDEEFALNYQTKKIEELVKIYDTKYVNIKFHASNLGVCRPEELIQRRISATDVALIEWEYINNELTAEKIAEKYKGRKGYSRENISAVLREYEIAKDPEEIQRQKIITRIERYGSASGGNYGKTEQAIREWLNSFGYNFINTADVIRGVEIDMYDADLKLGIEYCGLRWHSDMMIKNSSDSEEQKIRDLNRIKTRHNFKRLECEKQGIRLITIFEDEWIYRQSQCEGFLLAAINKNDQLLYGRSCIVKDIPIQEAKVFLENFHIQGSTAKTKHAAGLFYGNLLVGVMTLGTHPYNGNDAGIYLDRLCFKKNFSIVGGASKLFKHLIDTYPYNKIISWSDNRWSQGRVYVSLNFNKIKDRLPDYSYYDSKNLKRLHKATQRKDKIKCPEQYTEEEWANQNGKYKIWDCGKKQWEWNREQTTSHQNR